jgi:hypothetical protein
MALALGLKSHIAKRYRECRPLLDRKCVHRPLENCIIWARLHEELSPMLSAETSRQLFSLHTFSMLERAEEFRMMKKKSIKHHGKHKKII